MAAVGVAVDAMSVAGTIDRVDVGDHIGNKCRGLGGASSVDK